MYIDWWQYTAGNIQLLLLTSWKYQLGNISEEHTHTHTYIICTPTHHSESLSPMLTRSKSGVDIRVEGGVCYLARYHSSVSYPWYIYMVHVLVARVRTSAVVVVFNSSSKQRVVAKSQPTGQKQEVKCIEHKPRTNNVASALVSIVSETCVLTPTYLIYRCCQPPLPPPPPSRLDRALSLKQQLSAPRCSPRPS